MEHSKGKDRHLKNNIFDNSEMQSNQFNQLSDLNKKKLSLYKKIVANISENYRELKQHEVELVQRSIRDLPAESLQQMNVASLVSIVSDAVIESIEQNHDIASDVTEDIHEIMKGTILPNVVPITQPKEYHEARTTLVLDRRYHTRTINDSTFRWEISTMQKSTNRGNILGASEPLRDITRIRLYPFRIPATTNLVTYSRRVTIAVQELLGQSISAIENNRQFHFMMSVVQSGTVYELQDVGSGVTDASFYNPVKELSSLTLTFGNPFNLLTFDPDQLLATLSPSGVDVLFTFTAAHNISTGDVVFCTTFNTSNPTADQTIIAAINSPNGNIVAVTSPTTFTIPIDISGLVGAITGNPHMIYFESKRFIILAEIYFRFAG